MMNLQEQPTLSVITSMIDRIEKSNGDMNQNPEAQLERTSQREQLVVYLIREHLFRMLAKSSGDPAERISALLKRIHVLDSPSSGSL